jgi:type II secretory pathway component PulC
MFLKARIQAFALNSILRLCLAFLPTFVIFTSSLEALVQPSSLYDQVQLLGTISKNQESSTKNQSQPRTGRDVALIKHRSSGRILAIRVGEPVFEVGTLFQVAKGSVVIVNDDGAEITLFSKLGAARGPGVIPPPKVLENSAEKYVEEGFERVGNKIKVDAAYRDRMVTKELPTILMSAASEPVLENGVIKGFRLFQFEPGSIFEKIGMSDGDIVESINGVPLNDVARTIQFLNGLKSEKDVEVSIIRNGKPVKLNLNVN